MRGIAVAVAGRATGQSIEHACWGKQARTVPCRLEWLLVIVNRKF